MDMKDVWETRFPEVKRQYQMAVRYFSENHGLGPAYPLGPGYPELPFMASTVNLGPKTVTLPHRDGKNLATGLCAVMPFGPFESSRGGHLCLHEAGVVLELAPGQVVLFPSALIMHSNLQVLEGDKRYSITAYTAGQLFAWKANQGPVEGLSPSGKRAHYDSGEMRWRQGWKQFDKLPVT